MGSKWFWLVIVLVFGNISLAACGNSDSPGSTQTPAPAATMETRPATLAPALIHLQQDYERLSTAHAALSAIWEGLANGEQVQCGIYPELVAPDGISSEGKTALDRLAETLRRAAVELDTSAALWKAECANPRANPTPDVIQQGQLTTRAAGDSLRAAEPLLSGIQVQPAN